MKELEVRGKKEKKAARWTHFIKVGFEYQACSFQRQWEAMEGV